MFLVVLEMVPCFLLKLHLLIWVVGACNRLPIHGC
jgi:hypothetical protein